MFKPQDAAIADKLEFTRAAGGQVKIKMAADKPDTPHPLGGEKPDGDAPKVDWEASDMQGDHDEASVMEKYGSGNGEVYRAWIDAKDLPVPKGDDIKGGRLTEDSGQRSELSHRGSPPPIKVRVTARGKVELLDGNHRLAYWLERGHDSIPAYVIDERGGRAADEAAARGQEPMFAKKKGNAASAKDKTPEGMPKAEREPGKPVYLRVGAWDPDVEASGNFAKGSRERGVSVYALDKNGKPIAPEGEWAETDMQERLASGAPKYLVQGEEQGRGHDGEPLLKQVRVVGDYGKDTPKKPDFSRKEEARKPGEVTREEARQMGDLRKKVKVLEALRECLG